MELKCDIMNEKYLVIVILVLILVGCRRVQKVHQHSCDDLYQQALTLLNEYATKKNIDTLVLVKAEKLLDNIDIKCCPKMKYKVINAKISVYTYGKRYKDGAQYVSGIPQNYFIRDYTKDLYVNSMLACRYKLNNSKEWISYYNKAVSCLNTYLSKDSLDVQAICDFYILKYRFEGQQCVFSEIEEKMKTDVIHTDLFEGINNTINELDDQQLIYP